VVTSRHGGSFGGPSVSPDDPSASLHGPSNAPDGPSAARRLPAHERCALIEDAAARLFAERGYGATTVADIVAAAGVSKPMLYRHFESKQDLQMKLLARRRDELAAAPLDVFLNEPGAPSRRLSAMIDAWFAHVEQHPHSSKNLFQDATGDPEIEALQRELRRQQRAADVALLREFAPQLPEAELEPLGEIIRSALTGLALWWLEHPGTPRAVVVAAVLRVTQGVLATVG
jgi:AcrR family transcriptional regulator